MDEDARIIVSLVALIMSLIATVINLFTLWRMGRMNE